MHNIKIQQWNKIIVCQSAYYTKLQPILNNIEDWVNDAKYILKNDRTSTVVAVPCLDSMVIIKRANTKGFWHALRRLFIKSRAKKNWDNARAMLHRHLPTFEPLAYQENRLGPLRGKSYFVCSFIQGKNAEDFFAEQPAKAKCMLVIRNVVKMVNQLIRANISHRDLNLSNIIVVHDQPWLIDLDAAVRHCIPGISRVFANKEKQRFINNCQDSGKMSKEQLELLRKYLKQ